MTAITLTKLTIAYNGTSVIHDLNHRFASGQWHIILGRSGAGKTTLLHAIAGLLPPTATLTGNITTDTPLPLSQQIALMAQQNDILPWLTVYQNITLADRLHRRPPDRDHAMALLTDCGIEHLASAYPKTLSGGQRQRVALARTLMQNQPIVLMDEPFSALDAITRHQLQNLAAKLLKNKTVLMITHDPAEALRLADTLHTLNHNELRNIPLPNSAPPRALDTEGIAHTQTQLIASLESA